MVMRNEDDDGDDDDERDQKAGIGDSVYERTLNHGRTDWARGVGGPLQDEDDHEN